MNLIERENLTELLQQVSRLVDLFENRDSSFIRETKHWLRQIEEVLQAARLPIAAEVAARRADIVAAERGSRPEGLILPARASKSRIRQAVAIHSLVEAESTVLAALERVEGAYSQAEQIIRGVLVTANRKGVFNNDIQPPFTLAVLRGLWSRLLADETIRLHTSQILAFIGYRDALNLIGKVLEEWAREQNEMKA
ncbi:hypothetical protein MYX75_02280 [Acidobacteria bacterium AH-259-A15]|nr:hypothetical protein [Acidobacteria bacterium AH-259-A15]